MGIDTGANKKYIITKDNEVIFEEEYDEIEREYFKYPNAEFVRLGNTLKEMTNGEIDIRKFLIWDETLDYQNPDDTHIIKQLEEFSFEGAISEGEKAKEYIERNPEKVSENYHNINEATKIIEYLIQVWKKGYYISYS